LETIPLYPSYHSTAVDTSHLASDA